MSEITFPTTDLHTTVKLFAEVEGLTFDKVNHVQYTRDETTVATLDVEQFIAWGEALSNREGPTIYNEGGYWFVSAGIGQHTIHLTYAVEMTEDAGAEEKSLLDLLLRWHLRALGVERSEKAPERTKVATLHYTVETDTSRQHFLRDVYTVPGGPSEDEAIKRAISELCKIDGVYEDAISVQPPNC